MKKDIVEELKNYSVWLKSKEDVYQKNKKFKIVGNLKTLTL